MLAMLESGLVDKWLDGRRPAYLVYQTIIPQHIERMAGYAFFDQTGPRYVLGKDGGVTHAGQFHSRVPTLATATDQVSFF